MVTEDTFFVLDSSNDGGFSKITWDGSFEFFCIFVDGCFMDVGKGVGLHWSSMFEMKINVN